jgi:hypothetical protein
MEKDKRLPGLVLRIPLVFLGFVLFVMFFAQPDDAGAIPAWARKYKTSCATCHVAFPKMTAFGEAFRRNGFQFPDGTDPEFIKEEPVSIGAEGQKRAFPNAIWPGAIPGTTPVAFLIENEVEYNKNAETKLDFTSFPAEVAVLLGGTLGEAISFYGEVGIGEEHGVELERVYIIMNNMFGPRNLLNLKIGQFEPGLLYFSNHRRYGPRYLFLTEGSQAGDNNFSLEPTQQGLELSGTFLNGRFGYNAGLVEGRGNIVNSAKDFYLRGTYKIGGMRLDGVVPEDMSPVSNTQPWKDNSVMLGGFAYFGKAELGTPTEEHDEGAALAKQSGLLNEENPGDAFRVYGGEVQIFYDRLNLFGVYTRSTHDSPFIATPNISTTSTNFMVEANLIAYPWLIPFARFESFKFEDQKRRRFVPGVTALMRANVRFIVYSEINKFGDESFDFETIGASLVLGF